MIGEDGSRHAGATANALHSTLGVDEIAARRSSPTPSARVGAASRRDELDAEQVARRTLRREKAYDRARGILPLLLHAPGAEARVLTEVVTFLSDALRADGCDLLRFRVGSTSTLYRVSEGTRTGGTRSAKPDSPLHTGTKNSTRPFRSSVSATPTSPVDSPASREVAMIVISGGASPFDLLRQDGMTSLHTFIRSPVGMDPLGMLSAHTRKGACFAADDVALLDVVADLLGATLTNDCTATSEHAARLEETLPAERRHRRVTGDRTQYD
jgi:hypothetical protein